VKNVLVLRRDPGGHRFIRPPLEMLRCIDMGGPRELYPALRVDVLPGSRTRHGDLPIVAEVSDTTSFRSQL